MQTIKIDISDNVYDNVMFFLNNLPKKDIKLYTPKKASKETLTDFFQASPLKGIALERDKELYDDRVTF
jgi:hypothetical protein